MFLSKCFLDSVVSQASHTLVCITFANLLDIPTNSNILEMFSYLVVLMFHTKVTDSESVSVY